MFYFFCRSFSSPYSYSVSVGFSIDVECGYITKSHLINETIFLPSFLMSIESSYVLPCRHYVKLTLVAADRESCLDVFLKFFTQSKKLKLTILVDFLRLRWIEIRKRSTYSSDMVAFPLHKQFVFSNVQC